MQQERLINNSSQLNVFRAIIWPIFRSTRLLKMWKSNCPKHVELTGIINKPLLLQLVGCLYYSYFIIFF